MSDADQSGAGRREVAYRLFAAEYDDADYSYSESDEERAPNYVVTPTGGRVNRLFVVGVLTEVEPVSDDVLRARVVDPTGAFVLYAGQYQPDEQAFLDGVDTPTFVAVTGKARTFTPDDSDRVFTSIRPETISEVDAATRDRWTVQTAERTIHRVGQMATALALAERGDQLQQRLVDSGLDDGLAEGIALAIEHYDTSPAYLEAVREMALDAARVVADELDEVDPVSIPPDAAGEADLAALGDGDVGGVAATVEADSTDSAAVSTETTAPTETTGDTETATGAADSPETGAGGGPAETAVETGQTTGDSPGDRSDTGETQTTAAETTAPTDATGETEPAEGATETGTPEVATTETETAEPGPAEGELAGADAADGSDGDVGGEETPADEEIGDFEPGEFELDEEKREEIEAEYGTEFQSGTEVDEPGEADIDTPDPEPTAGDTDDAESVSETTAADATTESTTAAVETEESADPAQGSASSGDAEPTPDTPDAADVDLEDAVVEVMGELDDGSGADRSAVVETVADRYGADSADVADAIQDALMDGRCYEPDDETLKPI